MATTLLLGLCILLLTRAVSYKIIGPGNNPDLYFHLLIAREIRTRRFLLPKEISGFYQNKMRFPILFSYLLALLPDTLAEKAVRYSSILAESLLLILFWFALRWSGITVENEALILILFALYPAFTAIYPGPRTYNATPRIWVELLVNALFVLLFLWSLSAAWWFYVAAVVIGALILLTGKFGIQAILFFTPFLSYTAGSWEFLLLPIGAILLSSLISGGLSLRILKHQLEHFKNMVTKLQYTFPLITERYEPLRKVYRERGIMGILTKLMYSSDAFNFLIKNCIIPIIIVLLLLRGEIIDTFFSWWLLAGIVAFLLTSYKHLRFLGESERYLLFAVIPAFILFAQLNPPLWLLVVGLLFEFLFFLSVLAGLLLRKEKKSGKKAEEKLYRFIRKKKIEKILPIINQSSWELRYKTEAFLAMPISLDKEHNKYFDSSYMPKKDLKDFRKRFPFDYLLIKKGYEKEYPQLKGRKKLFENKEYLLYKWSRGEKR